MDAYGNGIRVKATYYVELTSKDQDTVQRQVQQKVDNPAQYFYAFDLQKTHEMTYKSQLSDDLKVCGFEDSTTIVSFPMGKNKFMVRIENMADTYTSPQSNATVQNNAQSVDLNCIAGAYWNSANIAHPVGIYNIRVQEKSLTGNMDIDEFRNRKIHWKVSQRFDPIINQDDGPIVTLVPQ